MCPGNQIKLDGVCMCPPYAPTYCEAVNKCINPSRDPDHCGDCNTKCGARNACDSSSCTPDLIELAQLAGCGTLELLTAPGKLYALSTKKGTLSSIAIPAGGAPVVVASGLAGSGFALDSTNAYVATGTTLTRVNLSTGMKTLLVTEPGTIFDVAVAQGKIYYATGKDIKQADATTPGVGTSVAVAADEGEPQGVAVSGDSVVYVSNLAFNVESDLIAGDVHVKLAPSQAGLLFGPRSVQTDATSVYWVNSGVERAPLFGIEHPTETLLNTIDAMPVSAFAVDSSAQMSYAATQDGSFEKSSFEAGVASSEASWVARALPSVSSIVLDATSVYLASECNILQSPR